jgi:glycerate 2-kinase
MGHLATMPPRRVLVCPQEFKGSLDPFEAAAAIALGVRAALPDAEVIERPLADGGPGTARILAEAYDAVTVPATVRGAYGSTLVASFALAETVDGPLAIIEAAAAVGLVQTPPGHRLPGLASSEGVGDLVRLAVEMGAKRLLICVGGTGSIDGGSGLARALGLRLLDRRARELPPGGLNLARLATIEDAVDGTLRDLEVSVAVDALNPLTGAEGAVAVFGAQKGMPDWQAPALDAALHRWAAVVRSSLCREIEAVPGPAAESLPVCWLRCRGRGYSRVQRWWPMRSDSTA